MTKLRTNAMLAFGGLLVYSLASLAAGSLLLANGVAVPTEVLYLLFGKSGAAMAAMTWTTKFFARKGNGNE